MRHLATMRGTAVLEHAAAPIGPVDYTLSVFEEEGGRSAHGTIVCEDDQLAEMEDGARARMTINASDTLEVVIETFEALQGRATFTLRGPLPEGLC